MASLQTKLSEANQNIASVRESNKQKAIVVLNKHANTANDAHTRADGLNPTKIALGTQRKAVRSMEGRLNKALVRRNTIETENNAVKDKINMLRSKMCNGNINRACIEKELKMIQERMDDIMRRAAIASDQTDKLVEQRNLLLKENLDEEEMFRAEYDRLSAYVAEQARLLGESIAASDVVASTRGGANRHSSNGDTDPEDGGSDRLRPTPAPVDDIRQLQEKLDRLDADYEASNQHLKATDEKNRHYDENLKLLQQVSGLESIDDIIDAFVKHEDESFSLFSYIQAINQEIDDIVEENTRLEGELEAYTKDQMQQEKKRAAVVSKYKDILKEAEEERRKMNSIAREGRTTVQKIAAKVQGLYLELRCRQLEQLESSSSPATSSTSGGDGDPSSSSTANDPLRSKLHIRPYMDRKLTMCTGKEISERNILHHMELIERRTCEIITVYAKRLASSKKAQRQPNVILVCVVMCCLCLLTGWVYN